MSTVVSFPARRSLFALVIVLNAFGCDGDPGPADASEAPDASAPFDASVPNDALLPEGHARAGRVFSVSQDSVVLPGARLLVDGAEVAVTDEDGAWSFRAAAGASVTVEADGHVPASLGVVDAMPDYLEVVLARLDIEAEVDLDEDVEVSDGRGVSLRIPADGLALPSGEAPMLPVTVAVAAIDAADPEQARSAPQAEVLSDGRRYPAPPFATIVEVTVRDAAGRELQPRPGVTVELDVPASDGDEVPLTAGILHLEHGDDPVWTEEGSATRTVDGSGNRVFRTELSHFSDRGYYYCWSCRRRVVTLSGRIVDGTGAPLSGVAVETNRGHRWTGADGRFSLRMYATYPVQLTAYNESGTATRNDLDLGASLDLGDVRLEPRTVGGVVCPSGQSDCGGACVDLASNASHCGGCGTACDVGHACSASSCVCPGAVCDGACVDTQRSDAHCGACGAACEDWQTCEEASCVPEPCPAGYTRCGPECVDLSRPSTSHCGGCGIACAADEQCDGSVCYVPAVCGDGVVGYGEACDDGVNDGSYEGCMPGCAERAAYCGDGMITGSDGETCDTADATGCPTTCDDGDACTTDRQTGSACTIACAHDAITTGAAGDGCCPPGFDATTDDDCPAVCGNGVREPGEACDDGNTTGGDGCSAACTSDETCGNAFVDPTEICDDGNTSSGDGCDATCTSDETCGNGTVDVTEMCDDGNTSGGDGCNATCTSDETCGNGFLDPAEACDDGNVAAGDGCNGACTSDETCGNGFLDPTEVCDDGNTASGDGCAADCLSGEICGNGVIDVAIGEVCDDANTIDGDGCSADCLSDESCGNNITDPGEMCDDGNTVSSDGCRADCRSDETCQNGEHDPHVGEECDDGNADDYDGCDQFCLLHICGNGRVDALTPTGTEMCDDGNLVGGDGCSADCTSDETCGNGVWDELLEVCDDGNVSSGDGCSADCQSAEVCGNLIVDVGEVCDDGNTVGGDGCNATCASDETCGNGFHDPWEVCDDGNTTDADGCSATCASDESCGNLVLDAAVGEACDDGNSVDGDGCSSDCASDESCGNLIVDAAVGEVCDDGNLTSGDGCSADCASAEICGNAILDVGEVCDDGNLTSGDGCSADCASAEICGNAILDITEICDDGNTVDGDGCSADCASDETCGNLVIDGAAGEACDDGNTVSGDGCSADCSTVECVGTAFTAPDPALAGQFGLGFAMDDTGTLLLISAASDDTDATDAGAVYAYRLAGSAWVFEQRITPPTPQAGATFGSSLDVSGDTLAVGARLWDGPGTDAGAVFVYRYASATATWVHEQTLPGDGVFGTHVALDGDVIASGPGSGHVDIYTRSGTTWSFLEQVNPFYSTGDGWSGGDIELAGTQLVIGDTSYDPYMTWETGRALVYDGSGGSFVLAQTLDNVWATTSGNSYGYSVVSDGTTLAIADPNAQYVRVYRYDGSTYVFEASLRGADTAPNHRFAGSLGLSASRIAVGANWYDTATLTNAGRVYVFDRDVGGAWSETTTLDGSPPQTEDRFGQGVAVAGDRVVSAAWYRSPPTALSFDLAACGF